MLNVHYSENGEQIQKRVDNQMDSGVIEGYLEERRGLNNDQHFRRFFDTPKTMLYKEFRVVVVVTV